MSHSNAHAALRDDLCRVAHSLFARGLVAGTAGNISARLPEGEGVLITPTDACLGFIDPAALAWVDGHGQQRSGAPASKTLALHQRIYACDPQAHCVIHTHSTQLVALTLQGVWQPDAVLPPITPYFVMKVGRVPLVPYARPGAPAVAEAIEKGITAAAARGAVMRAVLCERLGTIVCQR
jgi:ribulose-5-phosphate 4-epimerase/fuculose-1-phosphate aldolase